MKMTFKFRAVSWAIITAFPLFGNIAFATPYPPLPPTLSSSVTPNVMLYIDTSASMNEYPENYYPWKGVFGNCGNNNYDPNNGYWTNCLENATWQSEVDKAGTKNTADSGGAWQPTWTNSYYTKMNTAKRVAKNLVANNRTLRFGLFSFQDDKTVDLSSDKRNVAGVVRRGIADMSDATKFNNLNAAIDGIYARTATPLAEGLFELTRYFAGKESNYSLTSTDSLAYSSSKYISPIQYRCQKNFAIVITDGQATSENDLPGNDYSYKVGNRTYYSNYAAEPYTARDSKGGAVSKNFNICTGSNTTAADGLSVTCPSILEGGGGTREFGSRTNRSSALRDVAMYSQVADFKVGGTDLDGKSFDDPMFAKQNLNIYTVGFSIVNPVLPAAASVGGGKYYTASNEDELSNALNNAVASIIASTSNAGGLATLSEYTQSGNKLYQPVFNPNGWYGELRCFNVDASASNGVGTACSTAKATIPSAINRKIYSNKIVMSGSTPVMTAFDFTDSSGYSLMTSNQLSVLGADETERKKTINFIRGVTTSDLRSRTNGLLGDIIDGQPSVVAKPAGVTTDETYKTFQNNNANRQLVFVGANDGMLHGFNGDTMAEIMGYVPSAVYPRLKDLSSKDYGTAAVPHTYHVNGASRQMDIKVGSDWKTLLVGGLGQGGQGYFGLDATNAAALGGNSAVKWEWTDTSDKELGYTFGAPVIYNVRKSALEVEPAVILSNGYENSDDDTSTGGQKTTANSSVLYILNANTGALIKKISVLNGAGLSAPAGVDVEGDGVLDYVYAGDINGKMWRFDLTSPNASGFKVESNPIFDGGATHPIVMRPAIRPYSVARADGSTLYRNLVLFGTGKIFTDADRDDVTTQTIYAISDDYASGNASTITKIAAAIVSRADLQSRSVVDTATLTTSGYRAGKYRKMDTSPALDLLNNATTKKGWYLDLPDVSERLVTSPLLLSDKVLFGTGSPKSSEKCVAGGSGWIMGLNPMTGLVTATTTGKEFSFTDIKLDGKSTTDDKLAFTTGRSYVSGFYKDGIPTELSYVGSGTLISSTVVNGEYGDLGNVIARREANSMGVFSKNDPASKGAVYHGTIGKEDVEGNPLLSGFSGVTVETTTWRELK